MTAAATLARRASFPHGVHPPEGKGFAADKPIEPLPPPAEVVIPFAQHLGAPARPVVKPRQEVKCGDLLGEPAGFISAAVHCSINGKTQAFCAVTLPNARHVPAVPVKADGEQLSGQALWDDVYGGDWPSNVGGVEPRAVADAAAAAGLVGMGGAAFTTHVKLVHNENKPIDTILINGCECEPFLTSDYRLMLQAPRAIVTGALLAARAQHAGRIVAVIEDNKPRAIEAMRDAAAGTDIEVAVARTKYPQGGERRAIFAVTGRRVPTAGLPLDVGVVVVNVGTAAALARAVLRGRPLTHRVVCVTGGGVAEPKNVLAPIGTSYQALIDFCGGLTADAARVISGGPMMGFAVGDLGTPVTKGTSGLTVLTARDVRAAEETHCIRCGRCVDVCPAALVPTKIAAAAKAGDWELARRYYITACIECGCCGYICPARIPLVQLIRMGKSLLPRD